MTYSGKTITMRLTRQDLRGPNFELLSQNSSGGYDVITPVDERSYLGTVDEYPGAVACGALMDNGELWGAVYFDRAEFWHTIDDAVNDHQWPTGTFSSPTAPGVQPGQAGPNMYGYDVGVDAEYNYYTAMGSSVAACFQKIEHSVNLVRMIYMRDVKMRPFLGRVIVRTDSTQCPYYAAGGMGLTALKDEWNNNQTDADRDVVCGVNPSYGGGVAWVTQIGTSLAYSLNDAKDDVELALYHNLGALPEPIVTHKFF